MSDLPELVLSRGPWRAAIIDARDPHLDLGGRYVHGAWVRELTHDGRVLTGSPDARFDAAKGEGLGEIFEFPLGGDRAAVGEPLLRIGAGTMERRGPDWAGAPQVDRRVAWELVWQTDAALRMRCRDHCRSGGADYAYELERTVQLTADGLLSHSRLRLHCSWTTPVIWFAHPFWAQTRGGATRFDLPAGATPPAPLRPAGPGRWAFPDAGGFGVIHGCWGAPTSLTHDLDPALGGGRISIAGDRPLEKLVAYASPLACSLEPYWARAWPNGEQATWCLDYRFQPD